MNFSDHNTMGHRKTVQLGSPEAMSAYLDEVEDKLGVNARKADREAEAASEAAFDAMEAKWSSLVGGSVVVLSGEVEPLQFTEVVVTDLRDFSTEPPIPETLQEVVQDPSVKVSA